MWDHTATLHAAVRGIWGDQVSPAEFHPYETADRSTAIAPPPASGFGVLKLLVAQGDFR